MVIKTTKKQAKARGPRPLIFGDPLWRGRRPTPTQLTFQKHIEFLRKKYRNNPAKYRKAVDQAYLDAREGRLLLG